MIARRRRPRPLRTASPPPASAARRGTVIVVVIALLGALMLLGFLFLTLTMQEEQNSEYFSGSAKITETDPNVFFNEGLEQLIAAPDDRRPDSALYAGRHSLLANMMGADLTPYDGIGVGTVWDPNTGRPELDLNRDGVSDLDQGGPANNGFALRMSLAPGSQPESLAGDDVSAFLKSLTDPANFPAPDADYTYPDHNNAFLSYDWVEPVTGRRVVIPSFHRPQLLRNRIALGDYTQPFSSWPTSQPLDGPAYPVHPWYTDAATLPFVMRPHRERRGVFAEPGNPANAEVAYSDDEAWARRFVTGRAYDAAGNRIDPPVAFPDVARVDPDGYVSPNGTLGYVNPNDPSFVPAFNESLDREPLWRDGRGDDATASAPAAYTYDADPDNDGVLDAIWMDLGYPVQRIADGASAFVPMWAFKIVDMDALFNLNAHGNSYGAYADVDNDGVGDALNLNGENFYASGAPFVTSPISQSGPGSTRDEVNPQHALSGLSTADGATAEQIEAFTRFYDLPSGTWSGDAVRSRNLEWWFLLHGRASFRDDPNGSGLRVPDEVLTGRYGEPRRVEEGTFRVSRAARAGITVTDAAAFFPYPGLSASPVNVGAADDNGDALDGLRRRLPGLVFGGGTPYQPNSGLAVFAHAEGVPLDRRGSAIMTDVASGLSRLFLARTTADTSEGGTPRADVGVRMRFPALLNAVTPVYQAAAPNLGFPGTAADPTGMVGPFRTIWTHLAGATFRDDRNYTVAPGAEAVVSGAPTAPLPATVGGAAVGTLANADGSVGNVPPGPLDPAIFDVDFASPTQYGAAAGGANALRQLSRTELDDPGETIVDFRKANGQRSDSILGPAETVAMHMTDEDRRIATLESRVLKLAPVSFEQSPVAEAIRRRFTTASFDVNAAATPFEPPANRSPGANDRKWEFSGPQDDGTSGVRRHFPPYFSAAVPNPTSAYYYAQNDPFRAEVRDLLNHAVRNRDIADDSSTPNINEAQLADAELRKLVRKLSFNGVVERVTNPRDPLFDGNVRAHRDVRNDASYVSGDGELDPLVNAAGEPRYGLGEIRIRSLTPHPIGLSADAVGAPNGHPAAGTGGYDAATGNPTPRFGISDLRLQHATQEGADSATIGAASGLMTWDFPGTINAGNRDQALRAQEWHARRDRQNHARDLYVLLCVVGGVDLAAPGKNFLTSGAYSDDQLREYAQLAVNIVDAVDEDPVRTLFVYDTDLSDGYTALDDAYTFTEAEIEAAGGAVVAGVERQDLALSEVLVNLAWAETDVDDDTPANHGLTEWNDEEVHDFIFAELVYTGIGELNFARNPALGSAPGVSAPGENWRIVVRNPRDDRQFGEDVADGDQPSQVVQVEGRAIIPRAGHVSADRPYFTIASADKDYATGGTAAAVDPRSRIRVNFTDSESTAAADTATDGANWLNLAPLGFAPNLPAATAGTQTNPGNVLRDVTPANPAQILDTLVAPTDAAEPTFRLQTVDGETLTATTLHEDANPLPDSGLFEVSDPTVAKSDPPVVEVLLQTRLNPLRQPKSAEAPADPADRNDPVVSQERDNPWVTVDRMRALTTRLDIFKGDDTAAFIAHFQDGDQEGPVTGDGGENHGPKVASRVRRRPLLRASELPGFDRRSVGAEGSLLAASENADAQAVRDQMFNSIGGHDRNSPRRPGGGEEARPFDLWQPHFDRPFANPADLIGVPLYDAERLTGLMSRQDRVFGADGGGTKTEFIEYDEIDVTTYPSARQAGLGYDPTPLDAQDAGLNVAVLNRLNVAGSRLLYPDVNRVPWQDLLDGNATTVPRYNSWYRLLQYVGTPRRTAEMMTDAAPGTVRVGPTGRLELDGSFDLGADRTAAKVNLNTLRHPHVLAGLLDDERIHGTPQQNLLADVPFYPTLPALAPTAAGDSGLADNDFYQSLLLSRDGLDPIALPGVWSALGPRASLPGLAMRGLGAGGGRDGHLFTGYHAPTRSIAANPRALRDAIQHTPLRLRPGADASWINGPDLSGLNAPNADLPRAFFGVGAAGLAPDPALPDLDFTTRYQALGKVLNSATHRSNLFLCWMQVDFFHARELRRSDVDGSDPQSPAGRQRIVRIGAKQERSPSYRAAFLIDRSKVPALLRADHLPDTGTYSFARDPLSGGVKFPWQELILHRQRIQ